MTAKKEILAFKIGSFMLKAFKAHGVKVVGETEDLIDAFHDLQDYLFPPTEFIDAASKHKMYEDLAEWAGEQEVDANFKPSEVAAAIGVNTRNPSERGYFAHLTQDHPQLFRTPKQSAQLTIKALNGPTNGAHK